MSYDIDIGGDSFNYTRNMSRLFCDHIPDRGAGSGLMALDGLSGREAAEVLGVFFDRVSDAHIRSGSGKSGDSRFRDLYEPENGWGTVTGAIVFAGQVLAACCRNPDEKVSCSA